MELNEISKQAYSLTVRPAEKHIEVPVSDKILLTVEEAAAYSNIGRSKIREMIKENDCDYLVMVGNRHLIKRKKFEKFIESREVL